MRIRPDCSEILFSTLLGSAGNPPDAVNAIALDAGNNVYAVGTTHAGFPSTSGAFQPNPQGGKGAVLALIKNSGHQIAYATYFGGLDDDEAQALAVLPDQTVAVAGKTNSPGLPATAGTFGPSLEGTEDLFAARFFIENPGAISGFAFQDYEKNGTPDPYELPLAGLFVYRDLNENSTFEPASEPYTVSQYFVAFYPNSNVPFIPVPNYTLGNVPIGTYRICATFAPSAQNASTCTKATVNFGGTAQNLNFGLLPGQVGASAITPADVDPIFRPARIRRWKLISRSFTSRKVPRLQPQAQTSTGGWL